MLQTLLDSARIEPKRCAALLGINPDLFAEWVAGQRSIPSPYVTYLASVLGVAEEQLLDHRDVEDPTPAIWYKFRGAEVSEADREYVVLVRRIGFFQHELERATLQRAVGWTALFTDIRRQTNKQAAPREQGRQAARMFRESTGLAKGSAAIGELFRSRLQDLGVLVVETPVPDSQMEGCSFYVGSAGDERPCVFANSHHSTWFRRNMVLMHEVAHAIFDAESEGASLDFVAADAGNSIPEQRATAFAQEALVPREVLRHAGVKRGVHWDALSPDLLAQVVADCQVEQRLVLTAARDARLLSDDDAERAATFDVASKLPQLTERALGMGDFIAKVGKDAVPWIAKRTTTTTARSIRLPSRYVESVVETYAAGQISRGKASRLLMVDEQTFSDRFEPEPAYID